jgi:hypothetical protein
VKKLALCVPERPDLELDLTGDISQLKKQVATIILNVGLSLHKYTAFSWPSCLIVDRWVSHAFVSLPLRVLTESVQS